MLDNNKVFVGIAPINWSNDDLPELGKHISFEQCIDEIQLAGFTGCEIGTKFPRDPYVLKEMLAKRNLQVCNQWASYTFTTHPFDVVKKEFIAIVEFLFVLGSNVVGGGEVGTSIQGLDKALYKEKPINTPEQWKALTRGLNELGKIAREEYDITLCFHHHMGTCVQTLEETEILLHETDADSVYINYDCGHFFASDEDPLEALQRIGSRVRHVHLKDVRNSVMETVKNNNLSFLDGVKAGLFTVPDDGDLGCFPALFQELDKQQYKGWLVVEAEQDPDKDPPLEYAKKSRAYIKTHTGL